MADLLFKDHRDYIKFEFELRRARRPAYSMRAFARDLNFSPSSLSDFLSGRVGMSKDRITNLGASLHWSPNRIEHFSDLVFSKFERDKGLRQAALTRVRTRLKDGSLGLSVDAFKAISDWYHLVILEMSECIENLDAPQIAKNLDISVATASSAVRRLISLGLLKDSEQGLKPADGVSHFGDEAPSEAIVNFHCQILALAQKNLLEKPLENRHPHSLVFSIDQNQVERMNQELNAAVMNIVNKFAQSKKKNQVQVVTLQSFRVWKKTGEQNETH